MSGIVVLARSDGGPVDAALLERMTAALARRGPDGRATAVLGPVGLGHARLATTPEAAREIQPAALGDLWVAADLRIDGREELAAELAPLARVELSGATDVELLLHAYRAWGERCLDHLLGDFAFVLWDRSRRTLFAARDPFGVKLLYWTARGSELALSNTLGCLRLHPEVTNRLDPRAIGGLLLFGENWDVASTTFADVHAVPPGHTLSWSSDRPEARVARWWELPAEAQPLRYADARDYVGEFRALLDRAVGDRLRAPAVSVLMSGGVDSPMVAAAVRDRMTSAGGAGGVEALTTVFDELVDDRERAFSAQAAAGLGIPIRHFPGDAVYASWDWMLSARAPEPAIEPANVSSRAVHEAAARNGRVVLTGWDGDSLLDVQVGALWAGRLRRGELGCAALELLWHARRGRLPRVGVRATLRRWRERARGARGLDAGVLGWLVPGFVKEQRLAERLREAAADPGPGPTPRGGASRALASPVWRSVLDPSDAGMSGVPIEQRHPLLDVRIVRFALSLPSVPWCVDKHLFREATRGRLPEAVRTRAKTPFAGDPIVAGLGRSRAALDHPMTPELAEYVDLPRFHDARARLVAGGADGGLAYAAFNGCVLNGWLGSSVRLRPTDS